MRRNQLVRFLLPLLLLLSPCVGYGEVKPTPASVEFSELSLSALRCDGQVDPLGVDSRPRLSWQIQGSGRAQRQGAYRILVASSAEKLALDQADLWDSGRITSDAQLWIKYEGAELTTGQRAFWKVRIWDGRGRPSSWSDVATWTCGVVKREDWKARWITSPDLLALVRPQIGFRSLDAKNGEETKWLQLDLGGAHPIESIRLHAVRYGMPERFGFPLRFRVEASNDPSFSNSTLVANQTQSDYPNPWATTIDLPARGVSARYLRVTATKLPEVDGVRCLALAQVEVFSEGVNVAPGATVQASDRVENEQWSSAAVIDGKGAPPAPAEANSTLLIRREFKVRDGLRRALFFVSGLGHYELSLNGQRIGDHLLTPGWTLYEKTRIYDTLDVTAALRPGANAAGICLAGGMYNVQDSGRYVKFVSPFRPLAAMAQLRLEYEDGTAEVIATDPSWRVSRGPITFANIYGGEDYDARFEPKGWDMPGFNALGWKDSVPAPAFSGSLHGATQASPAFRRFETFSPVSTKELRPGVVVYDFGQNAAAMPRLRVRGPAGSAVRLVPAELLKDDGSVDRHSAGSAAECGWTYTLDGAAGGENWMPKFFYHGFRYLQVELRPGAEGTLPQIEKLESIIVHADVAPVGEWSSSSELMNRIASLVRWAQRSNLAHVLTDCPHRERLGWLEQYYLNGPSLRYNFDLQRLYAKAFGDMVDSQRADGLIPSTAPEYVGFPGGFRDSPEWGCALIVAAWQQYSWTGDDSAFRNFYEPMDRYVRYLQSRSTDGIVSHGLGDWYDIGPKRPGVAQLTPIALTATATAYLCERTMAQIARHLRRETDAARYEAAANARAEKFNHKFLDAGTHLYAGGSQTAQAMPLALGLAPDSERSAIVSALVKDIQARGNAFTAGDVGFRYLLRALADEGRSDVVFAMNNQSDKPGYGYQLAHGATALTESWSADRASSQNHFMLGQIIEWFYADLAGIAPDESAPGFKHILLRPQPVTGLEWVRARVETPRGVITASWRQANGRLNYQAEIPPNTTAELWLPATNANQILESGEPSQRRPGVHLERMLDGIAIYTVESGSYDFVVRGKP